MRRLGNVFIVVGLILLPTIIFSIWGFLLIGAGALLRFSAPKPRGVL